MKKIVYFIIFLFVFSTCEKDPFTIPVNVEFEFLYDAESINLKRESNTKIEFTEGRIVLKSIEFHGEREEGGPVDFSSDFNQVEGNLMTGNTNPNVNFDIPQGVYTNIELFVEIDTIKSQPALLIAGDLTDSNLLSYINTSTVKFRYQLQHNEIFELYAKPADTSGNIIIKENNPPKVQILIDPAYIFQDIMNEFNEAEISASSYYDDPRININREENTYIYNELNIKVLNKNSVKAVFK
jgi:hypothetical protein